MRGKITLSLLLPALLAANARQVTPREAEAAAVDFFKSAGVN